MALIKLIILGAFLVTNLSEIKAHGRLMDPVNRGSAYRKGFPTPVNYDDDANYCGGFMVQHQQNHGKCGTCGDNYADKQPRKNENGGYYGTGIIVKKYKSGSEIMANVALTVNHLGHFSFALCPLKNKSDLESEECFDAYKLELSTGGYNYPVNTTRSGEYLIGLRLPKDLACERCVLRWEYVAGNSWGVCEDGVGALGCGRQETFRTCSDITIK